MAFGFQCVCVFGSDADISPVIGSRAPRLPVCVLFVCVRVSRATNALILLRPRRYVCIGYDILASMCRFPVRTTSTLMPMPDRLSRPRMRYPAESVSVSFLASLSASCVCV